MAFQAVPDTAEVNVIYTLNGETVQNVFYVEKPGGYTEANLISAGGAIDGRVAAEWLPLQPPEAVYQRTEVRGLAEENDIMISDAASTGPGEDVSPALPNNVTLSVKKESGFTGRSARGRTYWIGIPQDKLESTNENLLDSTYVAAVVDAVDGIREIINTQGIWNPVLVSRFTGGSPRSQGITFPWKSSICVDEVVDTQRNRLP